MDITLEEEVVAAKVISTNAENRDRKALDRARTNRSHLEHSNEAESLRGHPIQARTVAGTSIGQLIENQRDGASKAVKIEIIPSPNPNDEESVTGVLVQGQAPGRRAGHTATAVNRKIYVFGGSCGSEYLNDFFTLDTDPPPLVNVSEPTSLQLFEQTLCSFYNNDEFSDVTFVVEGQKIFGHKIVLSVVSDFFRAMFTTGFKESETGAEIEIPNCSFRAFVAMMEYIYTGKTLNIDLSSDRGAAISQIVDLLELADQFFLGHLKQSCEKMLQPAVNDETVEHLLKAARKGNAAQLLSVCEHYLRNRVAHG